VPLGVSWSQAWDADRFRLFAAEAERDAARAQTAAAREEAALHYGKRAIDVILGLG